MLALPSINFLGGLLPDLPAPVPAWANVVFLAEATGLTDADTTMANVGSAGGSATGANGAAALSGKFEFDGSNDFYEFTDNDAWTPTAPFTFEIFRVTSDTFTGDSGMFSHYSADAGRIGWHIYSEDGGANNYFSWSTSGSGTTHAVNFGSMTAGQSYDLAVSWDGTNVRSYKNGVYQHKTAFSSTFFNAGTTMRVGSRANDNIEEDFLDGRIAALRMCKEALYTSELQNYTSTALPLPTS